MISKMISAEGLMRARLSRLTKIIQPNPKIFRKIAIRIVALSCAAALLSGCLLKKQVAEAPPPPKKVAPIKPKSAAPIVKAPKEMVVLAQTALTKLGYKIGGIDGLWGPRSAKAIREFEAEQKLWSANGHISELNLDFLRKVSGIDSIDSVKAKPVKSKQNDKGITAKLNPRVTLKAGPQLIIVDREYNVFSKPNPYSATLTKLPAGTGIYIVARESNWYQIESLDRLKGYVQVD